MTDPIKIRAALHGDLAEIRVLLQHPMETGQRKDEAGQLIAAHFIKNFAVSLNAQPLIDGQLNTAIAKNPLFAFKARGIKSGDRLSVAWTDSLGEHRQDEYIVP